MSSYFEAEECNVKKQMKERFHRNESTSSYLVILV
jgi:hypothetical protein